MEWLKEHKILIIAVFSAALFFVYSNFKSEDGLTEINEGILAEEHFPKVEAEPEGTVQIIMADIKGAVVKPGVYEMKEGDRVIDLVGKAGGITGEADGAAINFAMRIIDEMAVYIPKKGEQTIDGSALQGNLNSPSAEKNKVNLNRATAAELETLPGIGPAKAEAIIEFRDKNGPFQATEDLKKISGIGDKTFEKLVDLISVK